MTNKHEGYNLTYSHEIDDSKILQSQRIKIIISGIGLRLLKEATTLMQSMVETLRNRAS